MSPHLCLHGVGTPARTLEPGEAAYWITPDLLARVADLVAEHPDVRLSVDDGNASDVERVLPVLLERGVRATFFVVAGRLDAPGSLTAGDLRTLRGYGMDVGCHGMDHRPWRGLSDGEAAVELAESRAVLEEVLGEPVATAALPLGRYDRRALVRLRALGYARVHTSDRRPSRPDAWLQHRFSVRSDDTAGSLAALLRPVAPARRARDAGVGLVKALR